MVPKIGADTKCHFHEASTGIKIKSIAMYNGSMTYAMVRINWYNEKGRTMSDPNPIDEPASQEIVVTGVRLREQSDDNGSDGFPVEAAPSYQFAAPSTIEDFFAQYGGGETIQTTSVEQTSDGVQITIPGLSFPILIKGADWGRMNGVEKAAVVKMMTEFNESQNLKDALAHLSNQNIRSLIIHYDTMPYDQKNVRRGEFGSTQDGYIAYIATSNDGTSVKPGTDVVITINEARVSGSSEFARALAHEISHPIVPGTNMDDESIADDWEVRIYNDIFRTNGTIEGVEAYRSSITVSGSRYDDTVVAGSGNDALAGFSGNDSLHGGDGDDLVLGGSGMDRLTGGLGENLVEGGLDADTYLPLAGVTREEIFDQGGVDRLDLSFMSINDVVFTRFGDDLLITSSSGLIADRIGISGQWLDSSRVEQFSFAEGTYAASYIESLAGAPSGVCYDELGRPMFCSPYGLPVILDLDGDGIELIDVTRSRVRMDVNADGHAKRVGWVNGDDGILALDRNGNGRIDDFREISFRQDFLGAGSDLEGLYAYDSNGDGSITSSDVRFSDFLVWKDLNGNGHSEERELFSLAELGIVSISLERRNVAALDRDAGENQILATSTFQTQDGKANLLGDVALLAQFIERTIDLTDLGRANFLTIEMVSYA